MKIVCLLLAIVFVEQSIEDENYDIVTKAIDDSANSWFDNLSFQANVVVFSATADSLEQAKGFNLEFVPELSGEIRKARELTRISMSEDHDKGFENSYRSYVFLVGRRVKVTLIPEYQSSATTLRADDLLISHSSDLLPRDVKDCPNSVLVCGGVFDGTARGGFLLSGRTYSLWNNPELHKAGFEVHRKVTIKDDKVFLSQKAIPLTGDPMYREVEYGFRDKMPIFESTTFTQAGKNEVFIWFGVSDFVPFETTTIPSTAREIRRKTRVRDDGSIGEYFLVKETRISDIKPWRKTREDEILQLPGRVLSEPRLKDFLIDNDKLDFALFDGVSGNPRGDESLPHKKESLFKLVDIQTETGWLKTLLLSVVALVSSVAGVTLFRMARRS